jgi:thiosulfate dehydrogenase [quinone] large subunit
MKETNFSSGQTTALIVLRLFVGWHFLYEGVLKLYNPAWTAKGYLLSAEVFAPFFRWLAGESMIGVVDTLNIFGLVAIGAALVLGAFTRAASVGGILLLLLYYLAHPPFPGLEQGPAEGSYWIVNKNLVEMAALFVLYLFPTAHIFGLQRLWSRKLNPST